MCMCKQKLERYIVDKNLPNEAEHLYLYHLSTWEVEAIGSGVQGHPLDIWPQTKQQQQILK